MNKKEKRPKPRPFDDGLVPAAMAVDVQPLAGESVGGCLLAHAHGIVRLDDEDDASLRRRAMQMMAVPR
jgi:hypothetical protein